MASKDVELGDVDDIIVQSLVDRVGRGKKLPNKRHPSIYMVPRVFRDQSAISFTPRVVSIGPLHREDEKLQEFEVYKASTVHELVHSFKSYPPEQTLKLCLQKVIGSIEEIRECYAGLKKTYTDAELANMMVMDGCFVLAFFHNRLNHRDVVSNKLLQCHLIFDLLLLENQIPFFVLDHIFHVFLKFRFKGQLSKFMLRVLNIVHLLDEDLDIEKIGTNTTSPPHHILDLLHQCYRPPDDENVLSDFTYSFNPSAVDLDRAGVSFKPNNKDVKWPLAMEVEYHGMIPCLSWFWAKPTLRMPVLQIHDHTELVLRNLMAYEQSSLGCTLVSSYVAAMDMLVNTQEDIAMLVESKVLENIIGSNDEAADMINRLCKEIDWTSSFYSQQWKILDDYYSGKWPKHVAWLRRTYFSSPWNIIALVAGVVLFALTVVQTICSVTEVVL